MPSPPKRLVNMTRWPLPAAMDSIGVVCVGDRGPATGAMPCCLPVLPGENPSSPSSLNTPHPKTDPSSKSAKVAESVASALITSAPLHAAGRVTFPGTAGASSSPSGTTRPSCPSSCVPQVKMSPSTVTATECTPPATTIWHLGSRRVYPLGCSLLSFATGNGRLRPLTLVVRPSTWQSLLPHTNASPSDIFNGRSLEKPNGRDADGPPIHQPLRACVYRTRVYS